MKRIGKYIIEGLLGKGGMSRVYKVRLPVIDKIAALKALEPSAVLLATMGRERLRRLFQAEAVTLAGLRHPYLVEIWDYEAAADTCFYVMAYYALNLGILMGETWRTEAPGRRIPLPKAVYYIRQVLEGLDCLHAHEIVHRDIKPYNLLITEADTVKICDFGLSRQRREIVSTPRQLKVGSPWYAAPEQEAQPDQVDARADIYAVGVVLYRMLCGRLPEEGRPPLSTLQPDLDRNWDQLLETALARDRTRRFNRATQMLEALETCFTRWQDRQANLCRWQSPAMPEVSPPMRPPAPLRTRPVKVSPRQARDFFDLNDLSGPNVCTQNRFEPRPDHTVADYATGRLWQHAGFCHPLTWHQAFEYIEQLNHNQFAGRQNWRLPTLHELLTLLQPPPQGTDFCLPAVFDPRQKWLWSCDRSSFTAAWYVSLLLGFAGHHDFSGGFQVKGVCNL